MQQLPGSVIRHAFQAKGLPEPPLPGSGTSPQGLPASVARVQQTRSELDSWTQLEQAYKAIPEQPEPLKLTGKTAYPWHAELAANMAMTTPERALKYGERGYLYKRTAPSVDEMYERWPETRGQIDYLRGVQRFQRAYENVNYPEGATPDLYAQAEAELRAQMDAEAKEKRKGATTSKDPAESVLAEMSGAMSQEADILGEGKPFDAHAEAVRQRDAQALAERMEPGKHRPPMSDEELRSLVLDYIEAPAREKMQAWEKEHPIASASAQITGGTVPFLAAMIPASGVTALAARGVGLAGKTMGPAVHMATTMGLADLGMQGARMALGEQEKLSLAQLGESAVSGAVGGKVLGRLARTLATRGVSERMKSILSEGIGFATFTGSDEALRKMEQIVTGAPDEETMEHWLARMFFSTAMGFGIGAGKGEYKAQTEAARRGRSWDESLIKAGMVEAPRMPTRMTEMPAPPAQAGVPGAEEAARAEAAGKAPQMPYETLAQSLHRMADQMQSAEAATLLRQAAGAMEEKAQAALEPQRPRTQLEMPGFPKEEAAPAVESIRLQEEGLRDRRKQAVLEGREPRMGPAVRPGLEAETGRRIPMQEEPGTPEGLLQERAAGAEAGRPGMVEPTEQVKRGEPPGRTEEIAGPIQWETPQEKLVRELEWQGESEATGPERTETGPKAELPKTEPTKPTTKAAPKDLFEEAGTLAEKAAVSREQMQPDQWYTRWEKLGDTWVVDRTELGRGIKGDEEHWRQIAASKRPIAYFPKGFNPNQAPGPKTVPVQRGPKVARSHTRALEDVDQAIQELDRISKEETAAQFPDSRTLIEGASKRLQKARKALEESAAEPDHDKAIEKAQEAVDHGNWVARNFAGLWGSEAGTLNPKAFVRAAKQVALFVRNAIRHVYELAKRRRALKQVAARLQGMAASRRERTTHTAVMALESARGYLGKGGEVADDAYLRSRSNEIRSGKRNVRRVKQESWERLEILYDDGKRDILYHPDSDSKFQWIVRNLSEHKRIWSGEWDEKAHPKDAEAAENLALDIASHFHTRGLPRIWENGLRAITETYDRALGRDPYLPGSLTRAVMDINSKILGDMQVPEFERISDEERTVFLEKMDKIRELNFRLRKLLDFPEGYRLSEAMWYYREGEASLLRNMELGITRDRVSEALDIVRQTGELYTWLGHELYRMGFLTAETLAKFEGRYQRHMLGAAGMPRSKVRALALADAFRSAIGQRSLLDPATVSSLLRSGLKKRQHESTLDWAEQGGRTDFEASLEGVAQELRAVHQLRVYERLRDETRLFRAWDQKLPENEIEVRDRLQELEARRAKLEAYRVDHHILRDEGHPQTVERRRERSRAWRALKRWEDRMARAGIPTSGVPEGATEAEIKRIRKAQERLHELEQAHFATVNLEAPPSAPRTETFRRVNDLLDRLDSQIEELSRFASEWVKVPDKPQYGALVERVKDARGKIQFKGGWVRKDLWNEMTTIHSEIGAMHRMLQTWHRVIKINLTARKARTGTKNLMSNIGYNAAAGMLYSRPETWKHARTAVKQYLDWVREGKSGDDPLWKEYERSGIATATFSAEDIARYSGDTAAAARAEARQAGKRGQYGAEAMHKSRAFALWLHEAPLRIPGLKGLVGKIQNIYAVSDPIQAYHLYRVLRTGEGSVYGRPLSEAHAMAVVRKWYHYGDVPRIYRTPFGRLAFSFHRFKWKAASGVSYALATTPTTVLPGVYPFLPKRLQRLGKVRPTSRIRIGEKTILGDSMKGEIAATTLTSALTLGVKLAKLYGFYGLARYGFQLAGEALDEKKLDERAEAAAFGDEMVSFFETPLPIPGMRQEPMFLETWDINPITPFMESMPFVSRDRPGEAKSAVTRFARWVVEWNVLGQQLAGTISGLDWRGKEQTTFGWAKKTGELLVPGVVVDVANRIGRKVMGDSRKSWAQVVFDSIGLKLQRPTELDVKHAQLNKLRRTGEATDAMMLVPTADRETEPGEYLRQLKTLQILQEQIKWLEMARRAQEMKASGKDVQIPDNLRKRIEQLNLGPSVAPGQKVNKKKVQKSLSVDMRKALNPR